MARSGCERLRSNSRHSQNLLVVETRIAPYQEFFWCGHLKAALRERLPTDANEATSFGASGMCHCMCLLSLDGI